MSKMRPVFNIIMVKNKTKRFGIVNFTSLVFSLIVVISNPMQESV